MATIDVESKGFKKVNGVVVRTPRLIQRARKSAMGASANFARHRLRDYIESGFVQPGLHPLTKHLIYSRKTGKWRKRSKALKKVPFFKLRRFTGYHVKSDGSLANIGLGTKSKGGALVLDQSFKKLIEKHAISRNVPLTAVKRAIINKGLVKMGRPPLRKTTKFLKVPARNFMPTVFRLVNNTVPKLFDVRFGNAISRYLTGKPPKSTRIGL